MGSESSPRNTISVRFHLDSRADLVEEINKSLCDQGLVQIKASKAHIPLVMGLKRTCSDEDIDNVLAKLCPALEKVASRVQDFDFNFPGIGTFYNTGGKRDFGVVFLEPAMTPTIKRCQQDCYEAVESAIRGTQAEVDFYTIPRNWEAHLTIAKGIKRDAFSEVVRQVNQWALDGPFDFPEGDMSVFSSNATFLALKVKNYKGSETKVFEYKLAPRSDDEPPELGRERSSMGSMGEEGRKESAPASPKPKVHLPCVLGAGVLALLAGAAAMSAVRGVASKFS